MVAIVVLFLLIVVPLTVWGIVDPKGAWRATESWKYKNPDANEPSEASYALSQAAGVMLLVVFVIGGIVIASNRTGDDGSEERDSDTATARDYGDLPQYTGPERGDLGPGNAVGYRYPSELTLELVVMEGDSNFGGVSCATSVGVYEHDNAIVVSVTRRWTDYSWDVSGRSDAAEKCPVDREKPVVITRSLQEPLGDRPILTAAPVIDAVSVGLAYGPPLRPTPLIEVPEPGVKQPLTSVNVDPAWVRLPFLAVDDEVGRY